MLISFRVANYRSFGDEQTLSMIASPRLTEHPGHCVPLPGTDQKILRNAVIYGANAAGKSNLFKAMRFARNRILGSESEAIHFRFRESFEPATFEFQFLVDENIYTYGFDIRGTEIISEWLDFGPNQESLFTRNAGGKTTINDPKKRLAGAKDVIDALVTLGLRSRQLFLSRIADLAFESRGDTLHQVVSWFQEQVTLIGPDEKVESFVDSFGRPEFVNFASRYLQRVGTGIAEIGIHEKELYSLSHDVRELVKGVYHDLGGAIREQDGKTWGVIPRATHRIGSDEYRITLRDESDGTRRLLEMLPLIQKEQTQAGVVVVDEFDRSLHPLLSWEFVKNFNDLHAGERKQLIVTTHDTHLMHHDLLRRDEVFFIEKDEKQQSRISSLSEFNVRKDLRLEKGYLLGRFGGIPHIHEPAVECETTAVGD
ncbi:MAG: ATP-binding protein [Planctomycetaceae bacterium]|nr:ATP-binding protein [Planctomycetaceae bacterium]MCB9953815.1 ATP-binding protein [Planctomycetaceae bacterium]